MERPVSRPTPSDDQRAARDSELELIAVTILDDTSKRLQAHTAFAGEWLEEGAEILGISLATAKRQWVFARTWLRAEINASP